MIVVAGCAQTNHHLIHPRKAAPAVIVWSADFARDELAVHIEGARPPGAGPFPTVLVHPEEEAMASDMHGVIWDLAAHGYVAIAADYQRRIEGRWRPNMFAWRSTGDITLIIDATRAYPEVDQSRIGALGFSEGAVVSLLMAAHDPDRIKAVVAYYPMLKASGDTTELLVVPDEGRLFNFRQSQQATQAWQAALAWLDRYLHPTPRAGG